MKDDGEYRVEVKVRNNLILSAMEAAGYKNVNQLCVAGGFAPTHIGAFVNMKWSPLAADGDLTPTAKRLCDFLGVLPEDLWTPEQLMFVLPDNKSHFNVGHRAMMEMLARHTGELLEQPDIDANIESDDRKRIISEMLDTLSPTEAKVLRLRFGIDSPDEQTLPQIAELYQRSNERIRQIEMKAIRRLGDKIRGPKLKPYAQVQPKVDFDAIKKAHEFARMTPDERAEWECKQKSQEQENDTTRQV